MLRFNIDERAITLSAWRASPFRGALFWFCFCSSSCHWPMPAFQRFVRYGLTKRTVFSVTAWERVLVLVACSSNNKTSPNNQGEQQGGRVQTHTHEMDCCCFFSPPIMSSAKSELFSTFQVSFQLWFLSLDDFFSWGPAREWMVWYYLYILMMLVAGCCCCCCCWGESVWQWCQTRQNIRAKHVCCEALANATVASTELQG